MVAEQIVITRAEVEGALVDIRIERGVIASVLPCGAAPAVDLHVDAGGGAVIPGLHDHHIHLVATAAARKSIQCSERLAEDLAAADQTLPPGEWIRVVGHHESMVGEIDRQWLDRIVPDRPVRVQHRTGTLWVLNSIALRWLGHEGGSGRLFGSDALVRLGAPPMTLDVAAIGIELASYGVTSVTDLTPSTDAADLRLLVGHVTHPDFPVGTVVTGSSLVADEMPEGVVEGPVKVVVGDHELPSIDDLVAAFRVARRHGRAVAVHCVTVVGLVLALAAFEDVGAVPGDRIEHGAVIPADLIPTLHDLGLTVVTQPSFVHERGDEYLRDVDPDDLAGLWRCGSLLDAGIPLGGSTDAPYGDADPWRAIAAATHRRTRSGVVLGDSERISSERALRSFLGAPLAPGGPARRVAPGWPGELCVLDAPLRDVLGDPTSRHVVATVNRAGITPAAPPPRASSLRSL